MGVEALFRPTAAEVRALLSRIRTENIEHSLALSTTRIETNMDTWKSNNFVNIQQMSSPLLCTGHTLQTPTFQEIMPCNCNINKVITDNSKEGLERLLSRCDEELQGLPQPLARTWSKKQDILSQLSFLLDEHEDLDEVEDSGNRIRVFQWNVLSQAIGTKIDNLQHCPEVAMDWKVRGTRMVQELVRHDPDVICLQEVDQFRYIDNLLSTVGYVGYFMPKPDSPCLHLSDNSGPDGCAIFYKASKFELSNVESRVLEICGVQSNQVALSLLLRSLSTGAEFVASTTHLKAKSGSVMSALRNEQARDYKEHLNRFASGRPIICTGDFNCGPQEPAYSIMTNADDLSLSSAYASSNESQQEVEYTSWKFRGDTEHKEILDYIFYSRNGFEVESVLNPIAEAEVGPHRFPNLSYASDHISLVADLRILPSTMTMQNFYDSF